VPDYNITAILMHFMKSYKIRRIVELAAGMGLIEPTIVAPRHREKQ